MKTPELKPCPFCGGKAEVVPYSVYGKVKSYFVNCLNCGCQIRDYTSKQNAEKAWNEIRKRKSRWVKVEGRLPAPDEYDWVLVNVKFDEDGTYGVPHIAEYRNGEWWGYFCDVPLTELGETVTHWMPLPEYPEIDEIV